jgi:sec-independent protein translocase protein TatC
MSDSHEPELLPPEQQEEEPSGSVLKPFLDHLEDLRWMLIKMIAALGTAMFFSFFYARELLGVIILPLRRVTERPEEFLYTLEVTGGFTLAMKLAMYCGLVLSCPFLLYFLAQFILPALTPKEKSLMTPVFASGVGLFMAGVALGYFIVIPAGLRFFLDYNTYLGVSTRWTIDNYVSFVSHMCLAFGICFELPMVVLALAKLGIVTHEFLRQKRPYVIVLIFIVAAVITPTTDMVNQMLLAVPMCILYEACIWIAWWMERRRQGSEARS